MNLQTRIFLLISAIATCVGLGSMWFSSTLLVQELERAQIQNTISLVHVLQETLTVDAINKNVLRAEKRITEIVKNNDEISFAFIIGFDKRIFAHTFGNKFPKQIISIVESNNFQKFKAMHFERFSSSAGPLLLVGSYLIKDMPGRIFIGIDQSLLYDKVDKIRIEIFFLTASLLFIGLILAFVLNSGLIQPINHLAVSLRSFAQGGAVDLASKKSGYTEIDDLKDAFGIMVKKRVELENNLRNEQQKAEAASLAKTEFLATMSHEIRTPINAVYGATELLLETPLTAEQKKYVNLYKEANKSLLGLINDVLDVSRIEANAVSLQSRPVDLSQLVESVFAIFSHRSTEKGIAVTKHIDPRACLIVKGDELKLRQILSNVLSNAIKFTDQGEIFLKVSLLEKNENEVLIKFSLTDTGIGIPEEKLELIFEPFTQVDSSFTRKYAGSGLGLAIASRLVKLMKGSVEVRSKLHKGTTFEFVIPFELAEEVSSIDEKGEMGKEDSKKGKEDSKNIKKQVHEFKEFERPLNILFAEDTASNALIIQSYLKGTGHQLVTVENGFKALEIFKEGEFDLVLMDIQMGIMDGHTASRKIREWEKVQGRKRVPIIALTAHAFPGDDLKSKEAGCDEHLHKPISKDSLLQVIHTYSNRTS